MTQTRSAEHNSALSGGELNKFKSALEAFGGLVIFRAIYVLWLKNGRETKNMFSLYRSKTVLPIFRK